jgi:hypothetical protein
LIGTVIFQVECYIKFAIEMGDVEWNVSFTIDILFNEIEMPLNDR